MPARKTIEQKKRELKKKHEKKESDLLFRITSKYQKKIDEEFEKKKKRIWKEYDRQLHNLEVKEWEKRSNAKIRKVKIKNTNYADACELAQLWAKCRDTDKQWNWPCICCPWSMFKREDLDWGHYCSKWESRSTALLMTNINAQASGCNMQPWWRQLHQKPQIIAKRWEEAEKEIWKIKKDKPWCKPVIFIKENIQRIYESVLSKEIDPKKKEHYIDKIKKLAKKHKILLHSVESPLY